MAPPLVVVLDTNVVVAAMLWNGAPRELLARGVEGSRVVLASSHVLIDELAETLARPRFLRRVRESGMSVAELVGAYGAASFIVDPPDVPRVVAGDLDDDHVIAAAVTARADRIVTGDRAHLIPLGSHRGIAIVSPRRCLEELGG